ncbi:MAG: glycosyl transferase family 1 [Herpetosiphonaceae bacterium]|nr:MAG: glycosyl transferase family 1 [Herpetosiphonaceae bacterium]
MDRPFAIDARLNAYRGGGIPAYTQRLVAALAECAPGQHFLVLQHRRAQAPLISAPNVREVRLWTPPHHRFEQLALPLEVWRLRPALLHSPDFIPPLRRRWPAVITVHDLAFLRYPEILDTGARRYYGQIRAAVASADAIVADSESTRYDLQELLGVPPERVTVIYPAGSPGLHPLMLAEGERRVVAGTLLEANHFILFVSTLEPRKNVPTLLRALRLCLDREPGAGYRLVLAGARGWLDDPIFALARDLRLGDSLVVLGTVDDDELRWLYNACRLYVNASLYEGFGLPALEALQCGAASAVSNASSLPEVVGDAALVVPPLDVEAWAGAIARLWHDEMLRAQLRERALAQSARFSWRRAAEEMLAVYRSVLT